MPSLDTNALLRWLLGDLPEQAAAVDRLLASGERFAVDDAALIETVFVLERVMGISRPTVAQSIRALISSASLDFHRPLWAALASDCVRHPKVSIADLYLAVRAKADGDDPLYTFDKKLAQQIPGAALIA